MTNITRPNRGFVRHLWDRFVACGAAIDTAVHGSPSDYLLDRINGLETEVSSLRGKLAGCGDSHQQVSAAERETNFLSSAR